MVRRLISEKEIAELKEALQFKKITAQTITNEQLKKLIILIARKLGII